MLPQNAKDTFRQWATDEYSDGKDRWETFDFRQHVMPYGEFRKIILKDNPAAHPSSQTSTIGTVPAGEREAEQYTTHIGKKPLQRAARNFRVDA